MARIGEVQNLNTFPALGISDAQSIVSLHILLGITTHEATAELLNAHFSGELGFSKNYPGNPVSRSSRDDPHVCICE